MLPQTKNSFNSWQAPVNPQYQASNKDLTFSKCGDTKHRPGFNCPAKIYQCKSCKKYGHFTSKCLNLNIEKVQGNLHLVDAQEVNYLQSFNGSLSTIQIFSADCHSVSSTSESYSDSSDSFFVCQIQEQPALTHPNKALCRFEYVYQYLEQTFVLNMQDGQ